VVLTNGAVVVVCVCVCVCCAVGPVMIDSINRSESRVVVTIAISVTN